MRKSKAIFVQAWCRPKHLYVTLDSISRCHNVSDWDVVVSIDGGYPCDFSLASSLLPHIQIHRHKNLGCKKHPTETMRTVLDWGYERVLYTEDDHLFRSDMLAYMDGNAGFDGIVSGYHWPDFSKVKIRYTSDAPHLFSRSLVESLVEFMDNKRDVGLPDVCHPGNTIVDESNYKDASWYQWVLVNQIRTLFADEQMCLNFGYSGMHIHMHDFDAVAFQGEPSTWLDSVIQTAQSPEFELLMPTSLDFVYK